MSEEQDINSPEMIETQEFTVESLYNEAIDHAKADEAVKALLDEPGVYTSNAPMTLTPVVGKDGRKSVVISGTGVMGDKIGRLRAPMSWEYREKANGKPDYQYSLWLQARAAYKIVFGEHATSIGQVFEYLRDYPAKFRLIQVGVPTKNNPEPSGDPGNIVMGIYPIKGF